MGKVAFRRVGRAAVGAVAVAVVALTQLLHVSTATAADDLAALRDETTATAGSAAALLAEQTALYSALSSVDPEDPGGPEPPYEDLISGSWGSIQNIELLWSRAGSISDPYYFAGLWDNQLGTAWVDTCVFSVGSNSATPGMVSLIRGSREDSQSYEGAIRVPVFVVLDSDVPAGTSAAVDLFYLCNGDSGEGGGDDSGVSARIDELQDAMFQVVDQLDVTNGIALETQSAVSSMQDELEIQRADLTGIAGGLDDVRVWVESLHGMVAANTAAIESLSYVPPGDGGSGSAWTSEIVSSLIDDIKDLGDKIKRASQSAAKGRESSDDDCRESGQRSDWWTSLATARPSDRCEITEGTARRQQQRAEEAERLRQKAQEVADQRISDKEQEKADARAKELGKKLKDLGDGIKDKLREAQEQAESDAEKVRKEVEDLGGKVKDVGDRIAQGLKELGDRLAGGGGEPGTLPGASAGSGSAVRGKLDAWRQLGVCTLPHGSTACKAPFQLQLIGGTVFEPIPAACAPWESKMRMLIGAVVLISVVWLAFRWIVSALGISTPEGGKS